MTDFPLFTALRSGHPFRSTVDRFAAHLAARADCRDLVTSPVAGKYAIHAEIKAVPTEDGFRLDRFYWSGQRWDSNLATGFRAITLEYAAKTGETSWLEFPRDSYLPTLAEYFAQPPDRSLATVLRYVPLRRFTLREDATGGQSRITKFKRRSRFRQAYQLLDIVSRAIIHQAPGFSVAAPLGIDDARGVYFQQCLAGDDLAELINDDNADTLLHHTGMLHAKLHGLDVAGVPSWDSGAFMTGVRHDLRWIAFILDDLSDTLQCIARRLLDNPPEQPRDAFCHGDFVCSQILVDAQRWAITDFDLCCHGDSRRDIAMFLASLTYDVPYFARMQRQTPALAPRRLQQAREAYLAGYAAATQTADPRHDARRLAWHTACAEIYYLALMLKKDRFHPAAFDGGLQRLHQALEQLD